MSVFDKITKIKWKITNYKTRSSEAYKFESAWVCTLYYRRNNGVEAMEPLRKKKLPMKINIRLPGDLLTLHCLTAGKVLKHFYLSLKSCMAGILIMFFNACGKATITLSARGVYCSFYDIVTFLGLDSMRVVIFVL